jgi:hypothetical protein
LNHYRPDIYPEASFTKVVTAPAFLRSCTYPYNPGFSQKQRNKATVFLLAFIGKIRALGLVLCVKITSNFLGARCEFRFALKGRD